MTPYDWPNNGTTSIPAKLVVYINSPNLAIAPPPQPWHTTILQWHEAMAQSQSSKVGRHLDIQLTL